ncbi:hypothetical protein [Puia dinghuensis]|uniref:Stationary phase survival protein SurE n=1 Tax=Puia dinghuensis TaxID=1792502 RepID=A0A8J2UE04_9BACT|nr:hypothetical protein [Puia dinghuensis]GGB03174.1 hypothetical protein GCM10011511_28070 [Puia dinghuensis]
MIFKKDNLRLGLVLGLIAPILSLVIYYFVQFYPLYTIREFFGFIQTNKSQVTAISVPCLVLNIALFTIYINTHRDKTAKGVFAATLIYAILAMLFKFI